MAHLGFAATVPCATAIDISQSKRMRRTCTRPNISHNRQVKVLGVVVAHALIAVGVDACAAQLKGVDQPDDVLSMT